MNTNTDPVRALIAKWRRQAAEHGTRTFTGNDHALFANELESALASAPPSAPVGVEWPPGVLSRERTLDVLREHNAWRRGARVPQTDARLLGLALDAVIAALSQQPAAPSATAVAWVTRGSKRAHVRWFGTHEQSIPHGTKLYATPQQPAAGEEIMVNAAHDVYTLPLQPSGLLSGPRFVVHVPGPRPPAAVDGRIAIEPGERLFQFDSKQEWINHGSDIWRFHGVRTLDTVCVDALGRLVNIGKHFADAERDRAYPIVVYRLRADMNRNTGAAQQQGGAE